MITDIKRDFELTNEGDVDAFLVVKLNNLKDGSIEMTQTGLIDQILEDVGLKNESTQHKTPAVAEPLQAHNEGKPFSETWEYRSIVGKLAYLAKNTRPDIEYAVHQCACFQENPKQRHGNAVKRICRYLLGTRDKGIAFRPSGNLTDITAYTNEDFCGTYNKATSNDPNGFRS